MEMEEEEAEEAQGDLGMKITRSDRWLKREKEKVEVKT